MPVAKMRRKKMPSEKIQWDLKRARGGRQLLKKLSQQFKGASLSDLEKLLKPEKCEIIWYKEFGKNPVEVTKITGPVGAIPRRVPTAKERMMIHSHPGGSPGLEIGELKSFFGYRKNYGIGTYVIAAVEQGKLVGLTFMKLRDPEKAKKLSKYKNGGALQSSDLKEFGFQVRFAPMPGHRFDYQKRRFSKV